MLAIPGHTLSYCFLGGKDYLGCIPHIKKSRESAKVLTAKNREY